MAISPSEAAEALQDIDSTERRTRMSGAYAIGSPHLILWGIIWVAGYTACGLTQPGQWGLIWLPLVLAGIVGAIVLAQRLPATKTAWPVASTMLLAVATALFMVAVYAVFQPATPLPYLIFPALVAAIIYVTIGLIALPRYAWIGAAVFLAVMAGWLFAQPLLPFVIAAAGGGGLILGGLWLRQP